MKIIGLTGGYCAGKNEVAAIIAKKGATVIDVDRLGHQALEVAKEEIATQFGQQVCNNDGSIDRKQLGTIVFSEHRVKELEQIVHPLMRQTCIEMVESYSTQHVEAVVLNAALLHRMHFDILCDIICFVTACLPLRFYRAVKRDRMGLISFVQRLQAQQDIRPDVFDGNANVYIMSNSGGRGNIRRQVEDLCVTIGMV